MGQLHPDQRQALESPVTIVKRIEQAAQYPVPLEAVPYSEEYKDHLSKSADFLKQAADKTDNPSLATFLRARAQAFMNNEYSESDRLWLDVDSRVQIAIGPYEVKEDSLAGLKAAFEAFVYVSDQKFEFTSNRLRSLLPESQDALESSWANTAELEKNLPIPEELKNQEVLTRQLTGVRPTIHIGELLFASGDAMKDVITFAFDLPKDNKVRNEKGSRKVIMRNVVFAKFDAILAPMAVKIMKEKQIRCSATTPSSSTFSTTRSRGASVPSMLATTRARARSAKFSAAPPPPLRKPRQMLWGSGTCSISSTTATCPQICATKCSSPTSPHCSGVFALEQTRLRGWQPRCS